MKLPIRLISALALALLASAPLRAADPVEIKQHWFSGKKYYQTLQTDQQSKFDIGAQKVEQNTNMTIEMTTTVSAPAAGQPKRLTMRYERMAMEMVMNGQKMGYDSANPGANSDPLGLGKTIGATVGQELKMLLNDKDEVTEIENYDDFIQHLTPAAVPGFDPAKMFSRESLTQMMKQGGLHTMPEKPVEVGGTWPFSSHLDMPGIGKVTMSGSYTLKSVGDHNGVQCAELYTDGTLAMEMAAGGETASPLGELGMKVIGGTIQGSVWFDPQLGMARESQLVQEMNISMKNPTDPKATIDMPTKQTIHVVLTKVEDVK